MFGVPDRFDLLALLTPFGKIVHEDMPVHEFGLNRGKPRGLMFVEFATHKEASAARIALHGKRLNGRPLSVRFVAEDWRYRSRDGRPVEARDPVHLQSLLEAGGGAVTSAAAAAAPASGDREYRTAEERRVEAQRALERERAREAEEARLTVARLDQRIAGLRARLAQPMTDTA